MVFTSPSVRPQTFVASEPAYVVGTATTGRPVVSATALARPVVEPPPTHTSASTALSAADLRARSATSTGTCMTTSSWRTATGRSAPTRSAWDASAGAAMSITFDAFSAATSAATAAGASPGAKTTRWGRVSWRNRTGQAFPRSWVRASRSAASGSSARLVERQATCLSGRTRIAPDSSTSRSLAQS